MLLVGRHDGQLSVSHDGVSAGRPYSFVRTFVISYLLFGCSTSGSLPLEAGADAQDGVDAACAHCGQSLATFCADTDAGNVCPPALDSPDLFAWAQKMASRPSFRAPYCASMSQCGEQVMIAFPSGVDCGQEFIFDAKTKKLVAVAGTCDAFILVGCEAADGCMSGRCLPNDTEGFTTGPPACPVLPDAGL